MGQFRRALTEHFRELGTAVMGVLNATPDSFYDGGRHDGQRAVARVGALALEGAFALDVGGESTRPGSVGISPAEQLERIEPAVRAALAIPGLWVSVDTSDPLVAEAALSWGAHVINDVSCLADPDLAGVVGRANATLILMHARGMMAQMSGFSAYPEDGYANLVVDVLREWIQARDAAIARGLPREDILFDPGIGFAKSARHSMEVLRRLMEFTPLGTPIVVGPSRKSFLELVESAPPESRLGASVAACLHAAEHGAMLVRVHDVAVTRQALRTRHLLRNGIEPFDTSIASARDATRDASCERHAAAVTNVTDNVAEVSCSKAS